MLPCIANLLSEPATAASEGPSSHGNRTGPSEAPHPPSYSAPPPHTPQTSKNATDTLEEVRALGQIVGRMEEMLSRRLDGLEERIKHIEGMLTQPSRSSQEDIPRERVPRPAHEEQFEDDEPILEGPAPQHMDDEPNVEAKALVHFEPAAEDPDEQAPEAEHGNEGEQEDIKNLAIDYLVPSHSDPSKTNEAAQALVSISTPVAQSPQVAEVMALETALPQPLLTPPPTRPPGSPIHISSPPEGPTKTTAAPTESVEQALQVFAQLFSELDDSSESEKTDDEPIETKPLRTVKPSQYKLSPWQRLSVPKKPRVDPVLQEHAAKRQSLRDDAQVDEAYAHLKSSFALWIHSRQPIHTVMGTVGLPMMQRLIDYQWLQDMEIDVYFAIIRDRLIKARERGESTVSCTTADVLCGTQLSSKEKNEWLDSVLKHVRGAVRMGIGWHQVDFVLVPCNLNNQHWILVKINLREKFIEIFDSLGNSRGSHRQALSAQVPRLLKDSNYWVRRPGDIPKNTQWKVENVTSNKQEGGDDCGVFICKWAEALAMGRDHRLVEASKMPSMRKTLCLELYEWAKDNPEIVRTPAELASQFGKPQ